MLSGWWIVLIIIFCPLNILAAQPLAASECIGCHKDIYKKICAKAYVHPPFKRGQCQKCHLQDGDKVYRTQTYQLEHVYITDTIDPKAIYNMEAVFVDIKGHELSKVLKKIVPKDLPNFVQKDDTPARIFNIQVGPIKTGIFREAIITWQTNRPATSFVEFGLVGSKNKKYKKNDNLVELHKITLSGLEKDQKYFFRVASVDIFGHRSTSEPLFFYTQLDNQIAKENDNLSKSNPFVLEKIRFFWLGSKLALYFKTTCPSRFSFKYVKLSNPTKNTKEQYFSYSKRCFADLPLGDKRLFIDVCYKCHKSEQLGISHPINIPINYSDEVSKFLPLFNGNIITCVTCHSPHGSAFPYFAHKSFTTDTCIICHRNY
ncbi:MAG: cytochrome c3 family protein [Desulfonauticus sp.]|nr:cytochrome c3 family protein [Desulfonauticus sp.]